MEDKKLDKLFREHLSDFREEYDPESWSSLSDRLDAGEAEAGDPFDEEVRSELGAIEEPYDASTWPALLRKIRSEEAFEFRVVATKSLEGILVLLLILTAFRYVPSLAPTGHDQGAVAAVADEKKAAGEETAFSFGPAIKVNEGAAEKEAIRSVTGGDAAADLVGMESEATAENATIATQGADTHSPEKNKPYLEGIKAIPALKTSPAVKLNDRRDAIPQLASLRTHRGSKALAGLELKMVENEQVLWLKGLSAKEAMHWYIGPYVAADFNYIETPFDPVYMRGGYDQNRMGYGGGVSVMYGSKRLRLETGIGYSAKNYSPRKLVEIFNSETKNQYRSVTLDGIELNMVAIPLNAHVHMDVKGKWQFYGMGGLSLNLAVKADYEKERGTVFAISQPLDEDTEVTAGRRAKLDSKNFSEGLLEGGSFNDNHFITINAGLGVERMLSERSAIFLQPTYQSNFFNTGLGPNNDRIHIFSLLMGVRKRLR